MRKPTIYYASTCGFGTGIGWANGCRPGYENPDCLYLGL